MADKHLLSRYHPHLCHRGPGKLRAGRGPAPVTGNQARHSSGGLEDSASQGRGGASIPGWGLRSRASRPKHQNRKQKQDCNRFNKRLLRNGSPHQKRVFLKETRGRAGVQMEPSSTCRRYQKYASVPFTNVRPLFKTQNASVLLDGSLVASASHQPSFRGTPHPAFLRPGFAGCDHDISETVGNGHGHAVNLSLASEI